MPESGEFTPIDIDALLSSIDFGNGVHEPVNGYADPELSPIIDPVALVRSVLEREVEVEPLPDVPVIIAQPQTNGVSKGTDLWIRSSQSKPVRQPRQPRGSIRTKGDGEHISDDLVKIYLREIGKYPLLTKDDEVHLSRLIEKGVKARELLNSEEHVSPAEQRQARRDAREGQEARLRFINCNLRLVVSIAKKYTRSSDLPLLDLVQEGNLGLQHAVDKFDYRKGFKFSTYATWWIRQAITRGIANTNEIIRLPVHMGDQVKRVSRVRSELVIEFGRDPTTDELTERLEISREELYKILDASRNSSPVSLDNRLNDDENSDTLGDITPDRSSYGSYEGVEQGFLSEDIEKALEGLDAREREVIKLRFGLVTGQPMTLEEVGAKFYLTRERIRQIEKRAIAKLQHPSSPAAGLRHYLTG